MQQLIKTILEKYPTARATTAFGGPHEIQKLFKELSREVSALSFIKNNSNLIVKFSYGKGNWAAVPWLAILDSRETSTTQDGTYIVLLFREDGQGCHLKLAQGVTVLRKTMGDSAASLELAKRANEVRNQFQEMNNSGFDLSGDPRLGTENKLAQLYETSTIFSKYWSIDSIPPDDLFEKDLLTLTDYYEQYVSHHLKESVNDQNLEIKDAYAINDIVEDGCFLDIIELQRIIDRIRLKKNVILQGPPGTGKTWLAKRLAYALIGQRDHQRMRAVQFHPNLSYEDFVRGWRPSGDGKLTLSDGVFMEAVADARNTPRPYVVVIEEINRGNPAQIFGEMLTLLESDKRYPDEALELSYKRSPNERVYIPSNLYVIGTMNIADRSLALVDLALRRRFAFIDLEPNLNQSWRNWLINRSGIPENIVIEIEQRINSLNETISSDPTLGPQFQIGHSYVTPPLDGLINNPQEWFKQVVISEIGPLLDEYWYDSLENSKIQKDQLLKGL